MRFKKHHFRFLWIIALSDEWIKEYTVKRIKMEKFHQLGRYDTIHLRHTYQEQNFSPVPQSFGLRF